MTDSFDTEDSFTSTADTDVDVDLTDSGASDVVDVEA